MYFEPIFFQEVQVMHAQNWASLTHTILCMPCTACGLGVAATHGEKEGEKINQRSVEATINQNNVLTM